MNSTDDTPTFTRIEPVYPRDDCDSQLGIGKPVYAGEQTDVDYDDVWCRNEEYSFIACAQFALVDLFHKDVDSQASLIKLGQMEPSRHGTNGKSQTSNAEHSLLGGPDSTI